MLLFLLVLCSLHFTSRHTLQPKNKQKDCEKYLYFPNVLISEASVSTDYYPDYSEHFSVKMQREEGLSFIHLFMFLTVCPQCFKIAFFKCLSHSISNSCSSIEDMRIMIYSSEVTNTKSTSSYSQPSIIHFGFTASTKYIKQ